VDINGGGILYRMDLYTGSYVRIPINRLYTPTAIDYNAVEGRIYFVDPRLKQIASMHFSGDDIRELKQLDTSKKYIYIYLPIKVVPNTTGR
jgi:sugar lactone lactonase YvrE